MITTFFSKMWILELRWKPTNVQTICNAQTLTPIFCSFICVQGYFIYCECVYMDINQHPTLPSKSVLLCGQHLPIPYHRCTWKRKVCARLFCRPKQCIKTGQCTTITHKEENKHKHTNTSTQEQIWHTKIDWKLLYIKKTLN